MRSVSFCPRARATLAALSLALLPLGSPIAQGQLPINDEGFVTCEHANVGVRLKWSVPFANPLAIAAFIVVRDGARIAVLRGDVFEHLDPAPAPGRHVYQVFASYGNSADPAGVIREPVLIGACTIEIPGGGDGLSCQVDSNTVSVVWGPIFWFAPIQGYVVSRDGAEIARLEPAAEGYKDEGVPSGPHVYNVVAINFDGSAIDIGRCAVEVGGGAGEVRCELKENEVHLEWQQFVRVLFARFRITRNGETIAVVSGDDRSYVDSVFSLGEYVYSVYGLIGDDATVEGMFLGSCKVELSCFGLKATVDGLKGLLDWSHLPLPEIASRIFHVSRDGEAIGKTRDTKFEDLVPAPGAYVYEVVMDFELLDGPGPQPLDPAIGGIDIPARIIAVCRVTYTGGDEVPPPQDLECFVAIPVVDPAAGIDPNDPNALDRDGDGIVDGLLPEGIVSLRWKNPVAYDLISITRNGQTIATLRGGATQYTDHPPFGGPLVYGVAGLVGNVSSRRAECRVELPPTPLPPPRDFTCAVLNTVLDPADPDNPLPPVQGGDGVIVAPFVVVYLKWWNPTAYDSLVIARDDLEIARLPGSATAHRDIAPPPGKHVYAIYGVARGESSRTVLCEVEVGGDAVPPVRDLRCVVSRGVNDPAGVEPPPLAAPFAVLSWQLGGRYDSILIHRNNALLQELPGTAQSSRDGPLDPGQYIYTLTAVRGDRRSPGVSCQVVVEGPNRRDLLYFPTAIVDPAALGNAGDVGLILPSDRLTCLADTSRNLRGWSFGVAVDPKFVQVATTDLEDTATAKLRNGDGPEFLALEILDDKGGITMAAAVSTSAPLETLPAGQGQALVRIRFEAGPSGLPGEVYEARYSSSLAAPPVPVLFVAENLDEYRPATLPGFIALPGPRFRRGDINGDDDLGIADALGILRYLFLGDAAPGCLEAANLNGTLQINIADPIMLLTWKFVGGVSIPPPFPECGFAPAPQGCEVSNCP